MVDPPDIESHHSHSLNGSIISTATLKSPHSTHTACSVTKPHRISRKSARFNRINLVSLTLLLCIFAVLIQTTSSHALPINGDSDSGAIETRSPILYSSIRSFDTALLEERASLIGHRNEGYRKSDHYSSPAQPRSSFSLLGKRDSILRKREVQHRSEGVTIGYAFIIIILVLLSGVFAGLTLGYMSLDETQLQVLMTTGSELQKAQASRIMPVRKDGHLLLTTLLIANMITNETLPIIFDQLLPQVPSVVISTVLIVIFAELIPQSTCSRYGLQIGAFMAIPTRCIIILLWPISWPVSRILHWVLGPHHGIVYRRAELKELVTMHAASGGRGGDLKGDTVMIVGGALDLQEKVVRQAMTPIDQVFMLPFTAKLDYATLEKVVRSGHSRIPIYQDIEVQISQAKSGASTPKKKLPLLASFTRKASSGPSDDVNNKDGSPKLDGKDQSAGEGEGTRTVIRKKIVGTLLVKSCVLLDPEDAVPVSSMVINALPTVPGDEPLLNVLNVFQEGRSHIAIVSPRSRRTMAHGAASMGSKSNLWRSSQGPPLAPGASAAPRVDGLGNIDEEKQMEEAKNMSHTGTDSDDSTRSSSSKTRHDGSPKRRHIWSRAFGKGDDKEGMEQTVPSDATINEKKFSEIPDLRKWDSHQSMSMQLEDDSGLPLGIITLEDVLEELLGEEILDEYDDRGNEEQDFRNLIPPPSPEREMITKVDREETAAVEVEEDIDEKDIQLPVAALDPASSSGMNHQVQASTQKKTMLTRLGLIRQKSQRDSTLTASPNNLLIDEPGNMDQECATSSPALITPQLGSSSYFDEGPTERSQRPNRSSSVPPATAQLLISEDTRGRSISRPQTPSGAAVTASSIQHLYSPQANRPVVIRTQAPGGTQVTTIATESLLRGRQPSLPVGGVGSVVATISSATPSSRSQTPAGGAGGAGGAAAAAATAPSTTTSGSGAVRPNRFKSQAAVGVGGNSSGILPVVPIRSRSQAPSAIQDLSASIGSLKDNDAKEET